MELLPTVEVLTGADPAAAVIWLHGLGADGHDFEPVVPELVRPGERALRFVFPHAPVRPVALNNGFPMRAWYDVVAIGRGATEDEAGIRASARAIEALIAREVARGIPTQRIVLAGFSQGGAMALFTGLRYSAPLAGIVGLSCYLPLAAVLEQERSPANVGTPVFLAHGTFDPIVAPLLGEGSRDRLTAAGHRVEWHSYAMAHAVSADEIDDIAAYLRRVL